MIYLLDTDHISAFQWEGDALNNLKRRLSTVAPDDYGTTVVTYEEQCRGWLNSIHRAQTPETRIKAYAELKSSLAFYSSLSVWEYDAASDAQFVALTKAKVRVGTKDLRIASVALANEATVLTRNLRDFERVPGLLFADWTI